jgi:hypothetical protein
LPDFSEGGRPRKVGNSLASTIHEITLGLIYDYTT